MNIESVVAICNDNNIKFKHHSEGRHPLTIEIGKGRGICELIVNNESAEKLLEYASDFYKYRFVEGYEAIWSSELGTIECEIQLPHGRFPLQRLMRQNLEMQENGALSVPVADENQSLEVSNASDTFSIICLLKDPFYRPLRQFERTREYSTTIKMSGLDITKHEEALNIIETLFSAVCFQIDCKSNIPAMLSLERKVRVAKRRTDSLDDLVLSSVNYYYDKEAMSLYWYAQSAFGMPLLKFLAFYQVVEFYYPVYTEIDAQKKLRNVLKDPTFDSSNDKELAKLLNIIKYNSSSGSFGNELTQLKATIKECVDVTLLKSWLKENQERDDFFRSKNARKLSSEVINSNVDDDALIDQVVQRFYNIRCRIVHTKGIEGNLDVLHPQAKEIAHFDHDIELAQFIAHRVLIASSKPLPQSLA